MIRCLKIDNAIKNYDETKIYIYAPAHGIFAVRKCYWWGLQSIPDGNYQKGFDCYGDSSTGRDVLKNLKTIAKDISIYELDNEEEIEKFKMMRELTR